MIVEVISESTAKTDRTAKLNEYRLISSLQYYLIVEQESCFIEMYIREGERWYVEFYDKLDELLHFLILVLKYRLIRFIKK